MWGRIFFIALDGLLERLALTAGPAVEATDNRLHIQRVAPLGTVVTDQRWLCRSLLNLLCYVAKSSQESLLCLTVRAVRKGGAPWIELRLEGVAEQEPAQAANPFATDSTSTLLPNSNHALKLELSRRFCGALGGVLRGSLQHGYVMLLPRRQPTAEATSLAVDLVAAAAL